MQTGEPNGTISSNIEGGEIHFAVSGFWNLPRMESFLRGLSKESLPIVESKKRIHGFGDMTDFVPQTREASDAIRNHLVMSKSFGLTRVAILNASSLVKLQYKRLSEGLDVEFFEDKAAALSWLRRPYADAA